MGLKINTPAKLSALKARMQELGLWDNQKARPDFGWWPLLSGWHIAVFDGNPVAERVAINGVPWNITIQIPWGAYSPYAAQAHNFLA